MPKLSKEEQAEGLWYLAQVRAEQGKYREAIPNLTQLEKEISDFHMAFQSALKQGLLQGRYLGDWNQAEIAWQRASKLAKEDQQHWEADCHLATVPFFKKHYRQAVEALEGLLKQYPTEQTADFVRPYLWFIKNCTEKKI